MEDYNEYLELLNELETNNQELQKQNEALEIQNRKLLRSREEIAQKFRKVVQQLNSFDNEAVAKQIKKAYDDPDSCTWHTARELAPVYLSVGEASAYGKRLTDAYVFVTKDQPPTTPREGKLYPMCMKQLWSTYNA